MAVSVDSGVASARVSGLPARRPSKAYEGLWVIDGGAPKPAGLSLRWRQGRCPDDAQPRRGRLPRSRLLEPPAVPAPHEPMILGSTAHRLAGFKLRRPGHTTLGRHPTEDVTTEAWVQARGGSETHQEAEGAGPGCLDEARQGRSRRGPSAGGRHGAAGKTSSHLSNRPLVGPAGRSALGRGGERSRTGAALQRGERMNISGRSKMARRSSSARMEATAGSRPGRCVQSWPGGQPAALGHVALWVADRGIGSPTLRPPTSACTVRRTRRFTLISSDARRGRVTLFRRRAARAGARAHRCGFRTSLRRGRLFFPPEPRTCFGVGGPASDAGRG